MGLLIFELISGRIGLKWTFFGAKWGRGGAMLTPNELVLTFWGFYVCANFGEDRSRNATMRVPTDGQPDTHTQTQIGFIICPMLYAIAVAQIKSTSHSYNCLLYTSPSPRDS